MALVAHAWACVLVNRLVAALVREAGSVLVNRAYALARRWPPLTTVVAAFVWPIVLVKRAWRRTCSTRAPLTTLVVALVRPSFS